MRCGCTPRAISRLRIACTYAITGLATVSSIIHWPLVGMNHVETDWPCNCSTGALGSIIRKPGFCDSSACNVPARNLASLSPRACSMTRVIVASVWPSSVGGCAGQASQIRLQAASTSESSTGAASARLGDGVEAYGLPGVKPAPHCASVDIARSTSDSASKQSSTRMPLDFKNALTSDARIPIISVIFCGSPRSASLRPLSALVACKPQGLHNCNGSRKAPEHRLNPVKLPHVAKSR
mmetsp:Transcript_83046/g.164717  ORF Transcript_83046/g.164717 Transcript_83046/m.164717 type:complete len:238 (+) Transcript_83046:427-1140(+)